MNFTFFIEYTRSLLYTLVSDKRVKWGGMGLNKILGAVCEIEINQIRLDWQCWLPDKSKTTPRVRSYQFSHGCGGYSYGLGRSLEDCRPALLKGQKYQMVKTQTESHVRRLVVWTNRRQVWVFLSFEVRRGTAGICHKDLWGFSEAL